MNETTIYLIPEEAGKFLLFQQYYDPFLVMINSGMFQQRNATIKVYFDGDGVLQTIARDDVLYKRMMKKD